MVLLGDNSSGEKIQVKITELAVSPLIPPHPLTTPGHGTKQITLHLLGAIRGQQGDSCIQRAGGSLKPRHELFLISREDTATGTLPWWDVFSSSLGLWEAIQWLFRKSAEPSLPVRRFKTGQNLRDI